MPTFVNYIATDFYQRTHTLWKRKDRLMAAFIARHRKNFMSGTLNVRTSQKSLPREFIESFGLECCLWPHLYWCTSMCETSVRHNDARRVHRQRRHGDDTDSSVDTFSTSTTSQKQDRAHLRGRASLKQGFMSKVLSPVIGDGTTYDLFHFVYHLWLWSTVGAAKNSTRCPLRVEHPYHAWIEHEFTAAFRAKLRLPAAETLHAAHVLTQTVVNYICGFTKKK